MLKIIIAESGLKRKVTRDYNLAKIRPDLAKEWNPNRNGDLTPFDVTPGVTSTSGNQILLTGGTVNVDIPLLVAKAPEAKSKLLQEAKTLRKLCVVNAGLSWISF